MKGLKLIYILIHEIDLSHKALGWEIWTTVSNSSSVEISTTAWVAGVYVLSVAGRNGELFKLKVVK